VDKSSTSTSGLTKPESMALPSKGFSKDEEIRLRCVEAAARAYSGAQYYQAPSVVINAAMEMERFVKEGR